MSLFWPLLSSMSAHGLDWGATPSTLTTDLVHTIQLRLYVKFITKETWYKLKITHPFIGLTSVII